MKFLFLLFILTNSLSYANECARDANKFCQGVDPGKGQIAKCLEDYTPQLTPACAKELKNFKKETAKKNPCFEDLADLCVEIPAEAKNLEYCLLKNESRLSNACMNDFKKKKGGILVKNVCAQDIVNHCYNDLSKPEGAINHCLMQNRNKLSAFCQKSVDQKITQMKKSNPCFEDTEKYCPTKILFADIQECLEKKITTIRPECKKLVQNEIEKARANPCYVDLTRHCRPRLAPQEQHECLSLNEGSLSNACRQFRSVQNDKVKKMVDLCEQDRLKLCAKAPFKDGMVVKCLKLNKMKVSKQCAALL